MAFDAHHSLFEFPILTAIQVAEQMRRMHPLITVVTEAAIEQRLLGVSPYVLNLFVFQRIYFGSCSICFIHNPNPVSSINLK